MGYKLIALDIDGTIRSHDYPLSERTRKAIARVRETGATVTLVTGRMFRSAAASSAELNVDTPIATYQGAHIAHPVTGEVLWHRPLTAELAVLAFDALEEWGLEVVAYHNHDVYVSKLTEWASGYGERNGVLVNVVADLREVAASELTRLVVVGAEDRIKLLETALISRFDSRLHITRSLPHFCEILHPDSGKDKALAWLCNYLGIQQSETIAFGNGYNDIHMLKWASLAVVIGGAVPEALELADIVAPPIEEDGAAQVLENLLDQGLIG
jgi:Cof subfamily protein (haloacid dehalogenase superfamily)